MAAATGTLQTYQAVGNREDLSDLISNISPTDCPFQRAAGKPSKAEAVKFEWQTDALAPADTANAQIEGDDITSYDTSTPTVRVGNYVQISRKTAVVSGTQEAVVAAGRKSEMAYQMVKRTKELRRDMEAILLSNQASTAGATGTARKTGGIRAWLKTNTELGATGSNGGYNAGIVGAATDGTQRPLTEALFKSVLLQCYNQGGDPDTLMLGPYNKQVASTWTGNQTKTQDTSDKKLVASIDVYKSDFGDIKIVPNRFQRGRDGLVLQTDLWKVAFLRAVHPEELAKTGDAMKRAIIAEYGLQSMNEAGSGVVADLTTS